MKNELTAVVVALSAALALAEPVAEPVVETHQGSLKKVDPGAVECHHGSLKKPKDGIRCHHGAIKMPACETVDRETSGDRGGVAGSAEAATKGEVKGY